MTKGWTAFGITSSGPWLLQSTSRADRSHCWTSQWSPVQTKDRFVKLLLTFYWSIFSTLKSHQIAHVVFPPNVDSNGNQPAVDRADSHLGKQKRYFRKNICMACPAPLSWLVLPAWPADLWPRRPLNAWRRTSPATGQCHNILFA